MTDYLKPTPPVGVFPTCGTPGRPPEPGPSECGPCAALNSRSRKHPPHVYVEDWSLVGDLTTTQNHPVMSRKVDYE